MVRFFTTALTMFRPVLRAAPTSRAASACRPHRSKPFYITTPIFYVNASPHLGHLYSMLLCDVRNRWHKLDPRASSFFTTGTDEHGLKIQATAEKLGVSPKQLVDDVAPNFAKLADKVGIKYDRFIRTTDQDHVDVVKYFWDRMVSKGLIYEGNHSGWYSISDETFYPETQIEEAANKDGAKIMVSKETRNEVVFQSETNYFFKLAQFQDQLIGFLEAHPDFIIPNTKYVELLNELKATPLTDLSVSRPSSRLNWGIEVPNDPSQKIYVWFDALLNYLTSIKFPEQFPIEGGKYITPSQNPWPATHVIGKDIIRFHCIFLPIFLMAAGVELPKQVVVHSHWLSEGFKMSKSLGNVVDPIETCDYYGEDALRFFLMEYSNITTDCNYSEKYFNFTRDNLIGKYANLMTRAGGASFDIEGAVSAFGKGQFYDIDDLITKHCLTANSKEILVLRDNLIDKLSSLHQKMNEHIAKFENMKAIQEWWGVVELANLLFQKSEPWTYTKAMKSPETSEEQHNTYRLIQSYLVLLAAESVRITSIVIGPIIPNLSSKLLDRLNVPHEERNADHCKPLEGISYGQNSNAKTHEIPIKRIPSRL